MKTRQKRSRELTNGQLREKRKKDCEYESEVQKLSNARYRDGTISDVEYKKRKDKLWSDYSKWAVDVGIWETVED